MWTIFLIAFGALVVGGALLSGWGIPFIALFGVALVAAALFFAFQRTVIEPTTIEGDTHDRPSWARKHWWQ